MGVQIWYECMSIPLRERPASPAFSVFNAYSHLVWTGSACRWEFDLTTCFMTWSWLSSDLASISHCIRLYYGDLQFCCKPLDHIKLQCLHFENNFHVAKSFIPVYGENVNVERCFKTPYGTLHNQSNRILIQRVQKIFWLDCISHQLTQALRFLGIIWHLLT